MPKSLRLLKLLVFCLPSLSLASAGTFFGPVSSGRGICQVDVLHLENDSVDVMFGVMDERGSYSHFEVINLQRMQNSDRILFNNREAFGSDKGSGKKFFRTHTLEVVAENSLDAGRWQKARFSLVTETVVGLHNERNPLYMCPDLSRTPY